MENKFKGYYNQIFAFFYLVQGIHQAVPQFAPYYILTFTGSYDFAALVFIAAMNSLPWAFKFIIGLVNDRFHISKRFGRRYPFILFFGIYCGIVWILEGLFLPADQGIYQYLLFFGILSNIGMAVADTSIDGMILDITPKEKLGKIQAYTWMCLLIGMGGGAVGLGILFLWLDVIPILFITTGIMIIISCIFPKWVKEPPLEKDTRIWGDVKR
ncbi:MAG: MFS transporter, partial [Promethearchaeota archaeon]